MTPEEIIKDNNEQIVHIDKILELRLVQLVELNKLKHSLMIQSRALNPIFWLEGKKILELRVLYLQENEMRIKCGLDPMPTEKLFHGSRLVSTLTDWVKIEKSKWEKNRKAILEGKEEMIV